MQIKIFKHTPVMLQETLAYLNIIPSGIYVDATVGGAGHSFEIAKNLTTGQLFCFDKDPDAIVASKKRLHSFKNTRFFSCSFKHMSSKLYELKIAHVDGVLFDLGVSSFQIDEPSRGFSYKTDGPLDMRMNKSGVSAFDVVNCFDVHKLTKIISFVKMVSMNLKLLALL